MAHYGDVTYTTTTTSGSTGDWGGVTYHYYQPTTWYPQVTVKLEKGEDEKMECCHLCKAPLVRRTVEEWREYLPKKKRTTEDEFVWRKCETFEFECGTVVNRGDLPADERRVSLGDDCIAV